MLREPFVWNEEKRPPVLRGFCAGASATKLPPEEQAAEQYARFHGVAFEDVLETGFGAALRNLCASGAFVSDQAEPGHREVEAPQRAGRALNLALNRPNVLRWLENVTACGALKEVAGRVVQTRPRPGDELLWHDDLDDAHRRLAIVINLGTNSFEGGEFEIRRKNGDLCLQHKHGITDSMLFFRVNPEFEHRVMPLSSGGPRLVYTGWAFGYEE